MSMWWHFGICYLSLRFQLIYDQALNRKQICVLVSTLVHLMYFKSQDLFTVQNCGRKSCFCLDNEVQEMASTPVKWPRRFFGEGGSLNLVCLILFLGLFLCRLAVTFLEAPTPPCGLPWSCHEHPHFRSFVWCLMICFLHVLYFPADFKWLFFSRVCCLVSKALAQKPSSWSPGSLCFWVSSWYKPLTGDGGF